MKHIFLSFFICCFCQNAFCQSNFYVAATGNNTNAGTLAAPWKTIQHALNSVSTNSVIHVRAGTYKENLVLNNSGNAAGYITLKNYNSEVVNLNGTGTSGTIMLKITDKSYFKVQGLVITTLQKLDAQGILIDGTSHHIEVRNCKITKINYSSDATLPANANRNSQPLIVYGTHASTPLQDLIIDGNEIYSNRTGYSEALAVNGNVKNFQVTNNIVRNNTNIGIDIIGHEGTCPTPALDQARDGVIRGNVCYSNKSPYANAGGIYVDGGRDLIIERNKCYQNQYGIEIGAENVGKKTTNITLRNNVIYNNDFAGLAIGGYAYPAGSGKVDSCKIMNNTFLKNDRLNDFTGEITFNYIEHCQLKNNIFYARRGVMFYQNFVPVGLQSDYNCWFGTATSANAEFHTTTGFANYQTTSGRDAHSTYQNPLLVNSSPTTPDFHLQTNSTCVNSGDPAFVAASGELDFFGGTRKIGTNVDKGAHETTVQIAPLQMAERASNEPFLVFPNPATTNLNIALPENFKGGNLSVFTLDGNLIFETQVIENQVFSFDLSEFTAGVYCVCLVDRIGKTYIEKFVKY